MKVERASFDENPRSILEESYDCIWIQLGERSEPSPLRHEALQSLDWKLQGALSRFLQGGRSQGGGPTFLPTMKNLPSGFVAVSGPGGNLSNDAALLFRNSEGQGWKRILFYCEDAKDLTRWEMLFDKSAAKECPESIILATGPS